MATTDAASSAISGVSRELLVGGNRREATGGRTFAVEDPATGDLLCTVADAAPADAIAALDAASSVQPSWAETAPLRGPRSSAVHISFSRNAATPWPR